MCILNVKGCGTHCGSSFHIFSCSITNCLGKKQNITKRMQEILTKKCIFLFFAVEWKHFIMMSCQDLSSINSKSFFFTFQNSVKCIAIDFETYIFPHNSYSEPVCLMPANLPISHFPISFLSCHRLIMQVFL